MNCEKATDKGPEAYAVTFCCFRRLAKENILQLYITQHFVNSDNYPQNYPGFDFYLLDVRPKQDFGSA